MNANERQSNRYWGSAPMPKAKTEFFNAVTTPAPTGDGSVATIRMYGPIDSWGGFWGISTKDMGQVLDALPESVSRIILRINSPGGEVFEGVSILNMLRAHKASVTAVVDGLAASAASVIAAGADDTVMSPGTQMMIHSPWIFAIGNAVDLRKQADVLDTIESSLVEIYTAKAGEQDWTSLLADDTWLNAADAVELGLADRIAVVPDAGETETVGEADEVIVIPDEDAEDAAASLIVRVNARATARQKLPSSSEPGHPNRKEDAVNNDALKAGMRERLGVTDASASVEQLLAALDEALTESAEPTPAPIPEGTTLVENSVLEELRADAVAGREARDEQIAARREQKVQNALEEGKIAPARADHWRDALKADEEGASALLDSLAAGLVVPTAALGVTGGVDESSDEDVVFSKIYPSKES
ncbi:head maturation protease, ClpP-related [Curtobacterium flaccumfaciens]|uniref:head maturation protease, ClpP-related n=1 Tax=Curtobacterium flaccumfaciens TaxID=2035 RepID=UPI001BDEA9A1|nr:head maturation protease, ClpP-related [Curtobacterium flaccumfaciens]MBT1630445.1 Clp protease ClpP [Curtobacterium flaccumfaciens pv. oortii]MCX2843925.1 ATP-dependent Clp protease proteolytic subunit [Curtobacterium flaccumfaciens pv. oortii]